MQRCKDFNNKFKVYIIIWICFLQYWNYKIIKIDFLIYTWAENFRMRFPYLDYLIWVSNGQTFDFLLKPFFLGYSKHAICCLQSRGAEPCENARIGREKSKPVFKIREFLQLLNINLKWRAKFQTYRLHIRDSDWLNL